MADLISLVMERGRAEIERAEPLGFRSFLLNRLFAIFRDPDVSRRVPLLRLPP
jgi:hypothetical protein